MVYSSIKLKILVEIFKIVSKTMDVLEMQPCNQ